MTLIAGLVTKARVQQNLDGGWFTEIFYEYQKEGRTCHALTRLNYKKSNAFSAASLYAEGEAFKKRNGYREITDQ